jgi:hypothetical protein
MRWISKWRWWCCEGRTRPGSRCFGGGGSLGAGAGRKSDHVVAIAMRTRRSLEMRLQDVPGGDLRGEKGIRVDGGPGEGASSSAGCLIDMRDHQISTRL